MADLIVYFSRAGENYLAGKIVELAVGNTEVAAKLLQERTGAELFRLVPEREYSGEYKQCAKQAHDEQKQGARPPLRECPDSIVGYDTIYLGYPNYCGTMPMCLFTFLERFDFGGKTIKPFCTHEGSRLGSSVRDIKKLCPTANVKKGLAIMGHKAAEAGDRLEKWARE